MHLRDVLAAGGGTLSDTLHIVLGGVTVVLMLLAMAFGAAAFGKRFRLYSLASLAVLAVFGALTFLDAPRVGANLPTPWIGVWERIDIGVFLLWVIVLATVLLRPREAPSANTPPGSDGRRQYRAISSARQIAPRKHDQRPTDREQDDQRQHREVERLGGSGQDRLRLQVIEKRIRLQFFRSRPERPEHLHHVHRDDDSQRPAERGRQAIERHRGRQANRGKRAEQQHAVQPQQRHVLEAPARRRRLRTPSR